MRKTKYIRWVSPVNHWDREIHIRDGEFKFGEFKLRIDLDDGESVGLNFKKANDLILICKIDKPLEKPSES